MAESRFSFQPTVCNGHSNSGNNGYGNNAKLERICEFKPYSFSYEHYCMELVQQRVFSLWFNINNRDFRYGSVDSRCCSFGWHFKSVQRRK